MPRYLKGLSKSRPTVPVPEAPKITLPQPVQKCRTCRSWDIGKPDRQVPDLYYCGNAMSDVLYTSREHSCPLWRGWGHLHD